MRDPLFFVRRQRVLAFAILAAGLGAGSRCAAEEAAAVLALSEDAGFRSEGLARLDSLLALRTVLGPLAFKAAISERRDNPAPPGDDPPPFPDGVARGFSFQAEARGEAARVVYGHLARAGLPALVRSPLRGALRFSGRAPSWKAEAASVPSPSAEPSLHLAMGSPTNFPFRVAAFAALDAPVPSGGREPAPAPAPRNGAALAAGPFAFDAAEGGLRVEFDAGGEGHAPPWGRMFAEAYAAEAALPARQADAWFSDRPSRLPRPASWIGGSAGLDAAAASIRVDALGSACEGSLPGGYLSLFARARWAGLSIAAAADGAAGDFVLPSGKAEAPARRAGASVEARLPRGMRATASVRLVEHGLQEAKYRDAALEGRLRFGRSPAPFAAESVGLALETGQDGDGTADRTRLSASAAARCGPIRLRADAAGELPSGESPDGEPGPWSAGLRTDFPLPPSGNARAGLYVRAEGSPGSGGPPRWEIGAWARLRNWRAAAAADIGKAEPRFVLSLRAELETKATAKSARPKEPQRRVAPRRGAAPPASR